MSQLSSVSFVRGLAVAVFVATAVAAQQDPALRAEIDRELTQPPADDAISLEAQVLRLQSLLRAVAVQNAAGARVPAAALPRIEARGESASRPAASPPPTFVEASNERFRPASRPASSRLSILRPNPAGYVYNPATPSGAAAMSLPRGHMEPPKAAPRSNASTGPLRSFGIPSGSNGGFGGSLGLGLGLGQFGYGPFGSGGDPRFTGGYDQSMRPRDQ
jgi:hypothetical protein